MSHPFPLLYCLFALAACSAQSASDRTTLSDDFDRDMPFAYGMPDLLFPVDTSPAYGKAGISLNITGTVFRADGKTPAPGIIIYYYHTDTTGRYATRPGEARNMPQNRLGQTHGYLRGWVRSGADGSYRIHTILPGAYPGRDEPRHIHLSVEDPVVPQPYYIDDIVFDHDPLLTPARRSGFELRGGSGLVALEWINGELTGTRDVYLGANIPDYPDAKGGN